MKYRTPKYFNTEYNLDKTVDKDNIREAQQVKYVEVATLDSFPPGSMKSVTADGKEILIVNIEGKIYALGNKCTHAGGDLSKGTLEGKVVICPRHKSHFDVTTGSRISGPAKNDEPVYEVKVTGGKITLAL
jgi:3-phenylpropionate/trans-cinnamate dioxygenase ferredoxin component